jgi:CshA-type fibril repeat protein/VCBS repeat-containing protein
MRLEPRMMFDGAALATADAVVLQADSAQPNEGAASMASPSASAEANAAADRSPQFAIAADATPQNVGTGSAFTVSVQEPAAGGDAAGFTALSSQGKAGSRADSVENVVASPLMEASTAAGTAVGGHTSSHAAASLSSDDDLSERASRNVELSMGATWTADNLTSAGAAHGGSAEELGVDGETIEGVAPASNDVGNVSDPALTGDPTSGEQASTARTEVVFIDVSVPDADTLIAGLPPGTEVVFLDADRDGVEQIAAYLRGRSDIDAIHIVGHSGAGRIQLGGGSLDAGSIAGDHADELAAIGQALSPDADILLYGCDFGAGADGQAALRLLASATGADVAASTDDTGHAGLGGDWVLEANSGTIETGVAFDQAAQQQWQHLLAPGPATVVTWNADGTADGAASGSFTQTPTGGTSRTITTTLTSRDGTNNGGTSFSTNWSTNPGTDATASRAANAGSGTNSFAVDYSTTSGNGRIGFNHATGGTVTVTNPVVMVNFIDTAVTTITFPGATSLTLIDSNGVATTISGNSISFNATGGSSNTATHAFAVQVNGTFSGGVDFTIFSPTASDSVGMGVVVRDASVAPTNTVPAAQTTNEDTALVLSTGGGNAIQVNNPDGLNETTTVTLTASNGTITLSGTAGLTFTTGDGTADATMTFSGTRAQVNAALNNLSFTPASNYNGSAGISITSTVAGTTDTDTVAVTVNPVNDAPVNTLPSSFTTNENTAVQLGGLSVTDVDAGTGTVSVQLSVTAGTLAAASGGGVTVTGTGTGTITLTGTLAAINNLLATSAPTYTPAANAFGSVTLTMTTNDGGNTGSGGARSDVDTRVIAVVDVNNPPVANNDSFTVSEDTAYTINVRTNDTDTDGGPLTVTQINGTNIAIGGAGVAVTGGRVTLNAAGNLVFRPDANYNGTTSFTYTVSDGRGGTATATVTGEVLASTDPVTNTVPGGQTVPEDSPLVFSAANGNAVRVSDPDNAVLTVTLTVTNGTLTLSQTTGLTFTAGDGTGDGTMTFTGTAASINAALEGMRFNSAVADSHTGATFTISTNKPVGPEATIANGGFEQPDIPNSTFAIMNEDLVPGWETSATDKQIEIWDSGANGVNAFEGRQFAELNAFQASTLSQSITPPAGSPLNLSFAHRGRAGVDVMNVKVTDLGADGIRGTADDVVLLNENVSDGQAWREYQRNLGTASGNTILLEFTAVSTAGGNPTVGNFIDGVKLGNVTYQDSDSFNIAVSPVRDAADDTVTTNEDTAITFNAITGTNGATADSFESSSRVMTAVTQGANGTVTFQADGTITYTPRAGFHGIDSFTYTVTSGGVTETATVTVNVDSVNDVPVVNPILPDRTARDGATISYPAGSVFSDADGDTLTYSATGLPPGLSIDPATGQITGTLGTSASAGGPYSITVTATDPSGASVSDTFVLTVTNDAPTAVDDSFGIDEDEVLTGAVLPNDTDPDGDALTVSLVSGVANGTLVLNADGSFTYTPNANFNGTDSFTYRVTDADGASTTATVTITVEGINDPPNANPPLPNQTAVDSGSVSFAMGAEFTDADGDTLTFSATGLPPGLSIDPDTGEITGTLASSASANSPYVIEVTATDPDGASASASFTLTVSNPAPVAVNDSRATNEDTPVSGNVLTNDTDSDGDTLSASLVSGTTNGTVVLNADGSFTYTPNANFDGTDSFTYRVTDADGATAIATVTLTVNPVNDPPVAVNDSFTTAEDQAATIVVRSNDSDADNDPLTVTQVNGTSITEGGPGVAVTGGTVTLTAAGLVFTPTPNYNGPASFTYTVSDGNGGTATATVSGTVTPVNDAPVADDESNSTPEDVPLDVPADSGLLAGDNDVDGTPLTVSDFTVQGLGSFTAGQTASIPGVGDLTVRADGSYTFTPVENYDGPVPPVTYTISDGVGGTDTGTLTLSITPVNDPPVAVNDSFTTAEDQAATIVVRSNDSDTDNDPLTVTQVNGTSITEGGPGVAVTGGTVTLTAAGLVFTPTPNYNGPASFTYTVSDGNGGTATATVSGTVTPVNDAPAAVNDSFTTSEDAATPIDVLGNDSDPDGDPLAVTHVNGASISEGGPGVPVTGGTVTLTAAGLVFTPNANYNGPSSFTYTISDGKGGSATATVSGTVTTVNDPPQVDTPLPDRTTRDGSTVSYPAGSGFSDADGDTLTYSATGLPPGLSIDPATGQITGTLGTSASAGGPYTITVTATDPSGTSASDTFLLTVTNDAPQAVNDSARTDEDIALTGNVLANDTDPDGDALAVTSYTVNGDFIFAAGTTANIPGVGDLTINADGSYTFTPAPNYNGPVPTATYTVVDADGSTDTATLTIEVGGANDPPNANPPLPNQTAVDSGSVSFAMGAEFTDADGDTLTFSATGLPPGLSIDPDTGEITGTLASSASANSPYVIEVTATDPSGASASASFTLTVSNPAPVAANDSFTTNEDTPVSGNVLPNDVDSDGDALSASLVSGTTNGTVVLNADGSFTYTPNANFNGSDSFTYRVTDTDGATSIATVTLTVSPVNDPPVAVNDSFTTDEDAPATIAVTNNDSDAEGNPLTVTQVNGTSITLGGPGVAVTGGTVTLTADGLVFTPTPNYNGPSSFTYTVSDGNGGTATATVSGTVDPVNDPPVAGDVSNSTPEDVPLDVSAGSGLLAGASDIDGTPVTVSDFTVPGLGSFAAGQTASIPGAGELTIRADGSYTFTPVENYDGPVPVVTYTISDGAGGTDTGTLTLSITPVNDPPVALNDSFSTAEDQPVTIVVTGNDSDPDGTPVVSHVNGNPITEGGPGVAVEGGTVTLTAAGLVFTPTPNYNGAPSFSYTVSDGQGGSATATVSGTVTPVNDPPVVANDSFTTSEDAPTTIDVLGNDSDPEGDPLAVTHVDGNPITEGGPGVAVTGGTVMLTPAGLVFTPDPNYNGPSAFSYTVSDGQSGSTTATVSGTVTAVNDPPQVDTPLPDRTARDGDPISYPAGPAFSDVDTGDTLTYSASGLPPGLSIDPNTGEITGTLDTSASTGGPYVVIVTATDRSNASVSDSFVLHVTNDAPTAVDDNFSTDEEVPLAGNVLANDTDPDGDALTATLFRGPQNGTVTLQPDGSFSYTPDANFSGTDSFVYRVTDADGKSSYATATITVGPQPDAPIVRDDTLATAEDTPVTIDVLANDSDPDGDPLTITHVDGQPINVGGPGVAVAGGSVTLSPDGKLVFTPTPGFNGPASFSYTATDPGGLAATATATITVTPVNDAPGIRDDTLATAEDTPVTIDVLANDSDPDGDPLTITHVDGQPINVGGPGVAVAGGSVTLTPDGKLVFSPTPGFNGPASFSYTATDPGGLVATATVSIAVAPVNDAPVVRDDMFSASGSGPVTIDVLANDGDPDNDPLTITHVDGRPITAGGPGVIVTGGTITLTADGKLIFTPAAGFFGSPSFSYTVSDGRGGSATATIRGQVQGAPTEAPPGAVGFVPPWYSDKIQRDDQPPARMPFLRQEADELESSDLRIVPYVLEYANRNYGIGFELADALERYAPTGAIDTLKEGRRAFLPPLIKPDVFRYEQHIAPYLPEREDPTNAPTWQTAPVPAAPTRESGEPEAVPPAGDRPAKPPAPAQEGQVRSEIMLGTADIEIGPTETFADKIRQASTAFGRGEERLRDALKQIGVP